MTEQPTDPKPKTHHSFSLIVSVGKYGGFYFMKGDTHKILCLGCVSFTVIVPEYIETFEEFMATARQATQLKR